VGGMVDERGIRFAVKALIIKGIIYLLFGPQMFKWDWDGLINGL
jgi:hypothetical protein